MYFPPSTVGETTVHVIGKCPVKGCKGRKRNTYVGVVKRDRSGAWTEYRIPSPDTFYADGVRPTPVVGSRPSSVIYTQHRYEQAVLAALRAAGWVCEEHDRFMTLMPVKGIVVEDKTCDARCRNATGPNCECPCGGEQHGASWA